MGETGAWMPMYWADYFGDTLHLSTEEHGAYLLLLGAYWLRGKPLPDDDHYLAKVTRTTPKKWKKLRQNVASFFDIRDGEWIHRRVQKEALKSSNRLKSARAAGKAGGLAKSYLSTPTPTIREKESSANAEPKKVSDNESNSTKGNGDGRARRGTRLPTDWQPDEQDCEFARGLGLEPGAVLDKFRDYWLAKPTSATKLDWRATWRNWCRREAEQRPKPGSQRREAGGIVATARRAMADRPS